MADKDGMERRVYVLPADLVDRIKAYQSSQGIGSEVEAVRRLLDSALQMRDTVVDILNTLKSKHSDEKDLRVLARDVLTNHALVTKIIFNDDRVVFQIRAGEYGSIDNKGHIYSGDELEYLREVPEVTSWNAPKKGGDLDDEIPF